MRTSGLSHVCLRESLFQRLKRPLAFRRLERFWLLSGFCCCCAQVSERVLACSWHVTIEGIHCSLQSSISRYVLSPIRPHQCLLLGRRPDSSSFSFFARLRHPRCYPVVWYWLPMRSAETLLPSAGSPYSRINLAHLLDVSFTVGYAALEHARKGVTGIEVVLV